MSTTGIGASAPRRLLIVGDLALSRGLMQMVLTRLGYTVSCVGSAQEARNTLTQTRFALLLVALQLPDVPGLTLARRLRSLPGPTRTVPIVLFGDAWDQDRILEVCREARLEAYLPKPISIARLVATVGELIRHATRQPGAPLMPLDPIPIALEQFASFTDGNEQIERELSSLFLVTARHYLDEMRLALQKGTDWRGPAHALRGASVNIGATRLALIAAEAERTRASSELLIRLEEALETVRLFFRERQASTLALRGTTPAHAS